MGVINDYNIMFKTFKPNIIEDLLKAFKEESFNGESTLQYKVLNHYYIMILVLLIKLDFQFITGVIWQDLVKKYNLKKLKEKLACCKLDLDGVLNSYGLPSVEDIFPEPNDLFYGINYLGIEQTFEVEPDEVISPLEIQANNNINNNGNLTLLQVKQHAYTFGRMCCENLAYQEDEDEGILLLERLRTENCEFIKT